MTRCCRYERASELAKQRDLLAAWERDGHLRNMQKLKELGPTALREYVSEVMAPPPPASYSSSLSSSSFAASGASTTGAGVGFDPRGM
jgi:hypothetical protein